VSVFFIGDLIPGPLLSVFSSRRAATAMEFAATKPIWLMTARVGHAASVVLKPAATIGEGLYVYAELNSTQQRAIQRRLKAGELFRLAPGVVTRLPPSEGPQLLMREWMRIMAACSLARSLAIAAPSTVVDLRLGGNVQLVKGPGALASDAPMRGLPVRRQLSWPPGVNYPGRLGGG